MGAGFGVVTEVKKDDVPLMRSTSSFRLDVGSFVEGNSCPQQTDEKQITLMETCQDPVPVFKGDKQILCDLPDFFYFGRHAFTPRDVLPSHGNAVFYGTSSA